MANREWYEDWLKIDKRPKKGGWATGNYSGKCYICDKEFTGDKRAVHCAPCAYGDKLTKDNQRG